MATLTTIFIVLVIYFAPTIWAFQRKNKNVLPIFILNFFLGWTFIGWVISLVWAFKHE